MLSRQRAFLQAIAIGELQAQKDRLDVYTIQARFALAAIYDICGDSSGGARMTMRLLACYCCCRLIFVVHRRSAA